MFNWIRKLSYIVRWRDITRVWPTKRFLPSSDLDLSPSDWKEIENIHAWRKLVPRYLSRYRPAPEDGQFYCFGVAHGSTVHGLVAGLRLCDMPIPHMHLFDSFEGLPAEDAGLAKPPVWTVGAFAAPRTKLEARIRALKVPEENYTIHPGWFNETLNIKHVTSGVFRPAAYVDIDADLYMSTRDVLDFLFAHRLVRAGTLIGYDDWGDTDLWNAGESRAHKEITAKYNAQFAQLFSWGEAPLIKKLFLVVSVAGQ
jgi:hypothetical protein